MPQTQPFLVDMSSDISAAVTAFVNNGGVSGFAGSMHLPIQQKKVVVVPVQLGPGDVEFWGPCPQGLRAVNYHDPVVPGTKNTTDFPGTVWVQDKGWVLAGNAPDQAANAQANFVNEVSAAATKFAATFAK